MYNSNIQIIITFVWALFFLSCRSEPKHVVLSVTKEKVMKSENDVTTPPQINYKVDYVMGHFDPLRHPDFKEIPIQYADQKGRYMHVEALNKFIDMHKHAAKDGVRLTIKSAVRNFEYQKGIWERKWNGKTVLSDGTNVAKDIHNDHDKASKILEYSSMPGTSRHHWGTDIDINAFDNGYFAQGEGLKTYQWLQQHAVEYGYAQPYTAKNDQRPYGYNEEKWHWSYLPIAKQLTDIAKTGMQNEMIKGFDGCNTAVQLNVKDKYILGVAPSCL